MDTPRQTHVSLWLANKDLHAGKISQAEHAELCAHIRGRIALLMLEGKTAQAHGLKQGLMSGAARLTNRALGQKREAGVSRFPLRKT